MPSTCEQLQGVADGAIVGSGVVRRMQQNEAKGPDAIIHAVSDYCRELVIGRAITPCPTAACVFAERI